MKIYTTAWHLTNNTTKNLHPYWVVCLPNSSKLWRLSEIFPWGIQLVGWWESAVVLKILKQLGLFSIGFRYIGNFEESKSLIGKISASIAYSYWKMDKNNSILSRPANPQEVLRSFLENHQKFLSSLNFYNSTATTMILMFLLYEQ